MEHRWGHRIPAAIKVRLVGRPGAIGSGYLRDVSVSGAFVETALDLPLLTRVEISADLRGRNSSGGRQISGWVVRRDAAGIGVEWCEFAPQAISALLTEASEQPVPQTLRPVKVSNHPSF